MRSIGGRVLAVAAAALALCVALPSSPAQAAGTTVRSANTAVFTYDRLHPERTVVGSAVTYTRAAGHPLVLTITVVPDGRVAHFTATLANTSGTPLAFGSRGVRVEGIVGRNGRGRAALVVRAPSLRSLAPGARTVLSGRFALPNAGDYTVSAVARY